MVRSRNWPDLWWQISKIRDIQVVGIYDLMKRWRFETNRISTVATAQPQSQKPVFDFDLTWWPDLWWPGAEIFTKGVKFNCEQVLKKSRRCVPPFFRYQRKTGGVGIFCPPPPSSARVNIVSWVELNQHDLSHRFIRINFRHWRIQGAAGAKAPHSTLDRAAIEISPPPISAKASAENGQYIDEKRRKEVEQFLLFRGFKKQNFAPAAQQNFYPHT